jgi:hypothetical protein
MWHAKATSEQNTGYCVGRAHSQRHNDFRRIVYIITIKKAIGNTQVSAPGKEQGTTQKNRTKEEQNTTKILSQPPHSQKGN